jgi:putative peptide zinc metalloprotease protein
MDRSPRAAQGLKIARLDVQSAQPKYLVRLPDGTQFMVSSLVAQMLPLMDGKRSISTIAAALSARTGRPIDQEVIRRALGERLVPEGLVLPDSSRHTPRKRPSSLRLLRRMDLVDAERLQAIAKRLCWLYVPWVARVLLALTAACHIGAYVQMSVIDVSIDARALSGRAYLVVLVAVLLSVLVHELGHVAACARFGCRCGPLGIGIHVITPVLYVDVSPSWELPREQRTVVNAGGMYTQALFAILPALAFLVTGDRVFAWALLAVDMAIARNLNPFFKYDGYWLLCDLTGIPNLHRRVSAGAVALLQRGGARRDDSPSPPVKQVLALYGAGIVLFGMVFLVSLTRMVAGLAKTYPMLLAQARLELEASIRAGQMAECAGVAMQLLWPTIAIVGLVTMAWRVCRLAARAVVRPQRRTAG